MVDCWPVPMKKAYYFRLHVGGEFELVGSDSGVLRGEGDLLLALDARFAARDAAEASYLELPPVALLLEADEREVGSAGAIGDVDVEDGQMVGDDVLRLRTVEICIPVFVSQAIGEHAAGLAAHLRLADGLSLDAGERRAFFPVDAHFWGREIGSFDMGAAATTTGPAGGAGLIITLMTSSETLAALSSLRPFTLVSNCRVPPALAARILAMMTSSASPRPTMSMTSWLVILAVSC